MRFACSALCITLLSLGACQDAETDPTTPETDSDTGPGARGQGGSDPHEALDMHEQPDAGVGEDMLVEDMSEPVDVGDEGIAVALSLSERCEESVYEACARTRPLPERVRTVIDLTDGSADIEGRCDDAFGTAYPLPDDPEPYPVLVRVSSQGFKGTCTRCGDSEPPYGPTTYGIALGLSYEGILRTGEYTVVASVNTPWRIVSGEVGEAGPHACLSQYLEYPPTTCLHSYAEGLGVATDAVDPGVAEVIVDLLSPRSVEVCCHLPCPDTR